MNSSNIVKSRKTIAFQRLWSLHWIMAIAVLLLFIGGIAMVRMPRELFIRNPLYDFHKSIGVLIMALLLWRIFFLLQIYISKYKRRTPYFSFDWFRTIALHTSLYLLMIVVPLSGLFFSNSFKSDNVRFLGITLPDIFPKNSTMVDLGRDLHFWLAYGFLALIVLHGIDKRKFIKISLVKKLKKGRISNSD